ncbi:MAG: HAMP domain-containing histidine kinase [Desulfobacula sp.]|nr:HAMP domain-containing histidine kinase [Desulfobacula sp.]
MQHKFFNTIAFKLTFWFTGIFSICSGVAFLFFYYLSVQNIHEQIDQELLDNALKFTTVIRRGGLVGARELALIEAQTAKDKQIFFRLLYPNGEVFASSHMAYWQDVHISNTALRHMMTEKANLFETIVIPDTKQKARILYYYVASNAILQTGIAMEDSDRFLSAFKKVFISIMAFIIIFRALSGWMLIQKALSGVKTITRIAQNITGSNLEARVNKTGNKDELDLLADTFNLMLDRIEILVKNIREMNDNIAHDLKSPITRIRGFAELALVHEDKLENYRQMAATTIEESDRLMDMINTMLFISKAETGEGDFNFQITDVSFMVTNACDLFMPLAEDKKIAINQAIDPDANIKVDIKMLQRAFTNILDNAIKYTPINGFIDVSLKKKNHWVIITIKDTGIGIESKFNEKIFERFFRTEASRTTAGTGLGLSLARTIVRNHNGDVSVTSTPGCGSVFKIRLPINNLAVI